MVLVINSRHLTNMMGSHHPESTCQIWNMCLGWSRFYWDLMDWDGKGWAPNKIWDCYQNRVNPCWTGENNKGPLHLVHLQFWKPKVELKRMVQQEHCDRRESKYVASTYCVWQGMDDSQNLWQLVCRGTDNSEWMPAVMSITENWHIPALPAEAMQFFRLGLM